MANDPLYRLNPSDPDWWPELAEEAESLSTAICQGDTERRDRKIRELAHAIRKLGVEPT